MDRRALLPWLLGAAVAAAAAAAAITHGGGSVDVPVQPPPPPPAGHGDPVPAVIRRKLPVPRLPAGFPPAAAEAIRAAWPDIEAGPAGAAAAALATLTPVAGGSPLHAAAPAALEALAPALEALILDWPDLAVPAMRCAAALARAGGADGRAALGRTGLVARAFFLHALTGTPELQVETAALLGFAGGDVAQEILVLLLAPAKAPQVRAAAAAGLAETFALQHRLPADAIPAVMAAAGEEEPPVVRRAAVRAIDRAWEAFRPYDPGPVVAQALGPGDRGLRLAAATFFWNHPLTAQGPALVGAVATADTEVLSTLADALAQMKPEGWRAALEKRLPEVTDPEAVRSVRKALGLPELPAPAQER